MGRAAVSAVWLLFLIFGPQKLVAFQKCQRGTYGYWSGMFWFCMGCPGGTYQPGIDQSWCYNCPIGTYRSPCCAEYLSDCLVCPYSTYAPSEGTLYCTQCDPGMFSTVTGATSSLGCAACGIGTYSPPAGYSVCFSCPTGTYNSVVKAAQCQACPAGKYNSKTGSIMVADCTPCETGKYSAFDGQSTCTSCVEGKYTDVVGSNTCKDCPAGKFNSVMALSTCTVCDQGTYIEILGSTSCKSCVAGSYASSSGLETCRNCTHGSTYTPWEKSTSCLSCLVCNGIERYQYSPCNTTDNTKCCNNVLLIGTYASSCDGNASCPLLRNGSFINGNTDRFNRCMDFTCHQGYYAPALEMAKASILCQTSNYVLNPLCAPYLNSICALATSCPSGVSTILRTPLGLNILNTTSNDMQCANCVPCMAGTIEISPCTDTTQTVCAICSVVGTYASIPWNGRCMYYDTAPGIMTLSQTPIGYFPYVLSLTDAVIGAIADNSISYPTKRVVAFNEQNSKTIESLTKLYMGKITWDEFNAERKSNADRARAEFEKINKDPSLQK